MKRRCPLCASICAGSSTATSSTHSPASAWRLGSLAQNCSRLSSSAETHAVLPAATRAVHWRFYCSYSSSRAKEAARSVEYERESKSAFSVRLGSSLCFAAMAVILRFIVPQKLVRHSTARSFSSVPPKRAHSPSKFHFHLSTAFHGKPTEADDPAPSPRLQRRPKQKLLQGNPFLAHSHSQVSTHRILTLQASHPTLPSLVGVTISSAKSLGPQVTIGTSLLQTRPTKMSLLG